MALPVAAGMLRWRRVASSKSGAKERFRSVRMQTARNQATRDGGREPATPPSAPAARKAGDGTPYPTAPLLERLVVVLLFVFLLVGVCLVLRPFFTALLFGGTVAIATWPLHEWLIRRGMANSVAAALLCVLVIICLVGPILSLGPELGDRLALIVRKSQEVLEREQGLPRWLADIPVIGPQANRLWHDLHAGQIQETLKPYANGLRTLALQIGAGAVEAVVQILLSLVVATMFWLRGQILRDVLIEISERLGGRIGPEILKTAVVSVRGVSYGIVGTAAAQALALTFGLALAGVPSAALLGFIAFVIALSQIGILLVAVWGAAVYWLYSTGEPSWAIFMLVWGIIVSVMDNVMRPVLVGVGSSMPMTLVFLGVFGGLVAFGFLGMFIGPTLLAILFAVLQSWRARERAETAASVE